MSALHDLLIQYRSAAKTEREKGTYFEKLIVDFLRNDPTYASQYDAVWTYADWAKENGLSGADTGIDLVARVTEDGTFCAIQCKFYDEDHTIQKGDIDKFFSASGKAHFTRRLFVDTTRNEWGKNALDILTNQAIETMRLSIHDLEQSPIDWSVYAVDRSIEVAPKKELRPFQQKALEEVKAGLAKADRGKLIMACGTGKTLTSLRIAEEIAGAGKRILYLVPSLALMAQTVREWSVDAKVPIRAFAACSDVQVGKRKANSDIASINIHDLAYPATTNAAKLAEKVADHHVNDRMTVIFATYQSIQVIADAQARYGLKDFDLIICDEAHRTTGATLSGEDESNFVKVHNQEHIKGHKRLYMTATPRIYGDAVKTKADEYSVELCSMDDVSLYGETLHTINFSEAVRNEILTDYKVIVLAVDETVVSAGVQKRLTDHDSELVLDDATKIIGCYRALSKHGLKKDLIADSAPMRRAVAFCRDIKRSKLVKQEFSAVVDEYLAEQGEDGETLLHCEVDHVDGTFNATQRYELLNWLSENNDPDNCRILSNARCLSEGVDVPTLDAILFLHPRKSQVDVVQSVGRVMRRAEGKKMGYVILPVGVPAGVEPDVALNNNEKYRVVWQILNALRAHDDRLDATINKAGLGVDVSEQIEIVAVANNLPGKADPEVTQLDLGGGGDESEKPADSEPQSQMLLGLDEFSKAIMAKIVKKCGTRTYWDTWATDIAKIAQTHITRIKGILSKPGRERTAFDSFLAEIRDDLNESISEDDAIEMLAQHIITKPVFDSLFEGYSFTKNNPVSKAMQGVLDILNEHSLEKESESLQKFYDSVKRRAAGIDSAEAKQKIVVELYDKFFRNAFPRMTERLGIVYTPIEVVDFIIHSINDILQNEFGQTLGSKGVHILDPFAGTGTFITRLLQSGLIKPEELAYKYGHEIHANEIVLLAYYIAAINIEQVFHALNGGEYKPFEGICLTDTFQLYEKDDMISNILVDNSTRRTRQKALDIRVIMGNPPYSAGQTNANDNNQNVKYKSLDYRIGETYAKSSTATNKNALYDSYIRAFRWASDRIGDSGVIGFVSNAGFLEANTADGLRKCLTEEFSNIYVFHLRGNARTSGELRRKEKDNVFGQGTRTPIAITLLVKNPLAHKHGQILLYDIGDYLTREEKLATIARFKSIAGISAKELWRTITPDKHYDWLNQRDDRFDRFIKIGDKKNKRGKAFFQNYSRGLETARDAWCYNYSKNEVANNVERMAAFYLSELERYTKACQGHDHKPKIPDFVNHDSTKISWSTSLYSSLKSEQQIRFNAGHISPVLYRPFTKCWVYFDQYLNHRTYQLPKIYPDNSSMNRVIMVKQRWGGIGQLALMVDRIPDLQTDGGAQCFPLYLYEKPNNDNPTREFQFPGKTGADEYTRIDAISTEGLAHFQAAYPGEKISKEDLFYYIYGLLHSEDYRSRYADNLSKELPRIPAVKTAADFWAFSQAGRKLGDLHVNYETVEPYPVGYKGGAMFIDQMKPEDFRVKQMKFGGKGRDKDKTTVVYNSHITMTGIPLEAYDYVVNGKPALEWVMERQCVKTDKNSGIVNDANRYAIETVGDPAYPLRLFQRIITVSLETMKIVRNLPKLDIPEVD